MNHADSPRKAQFHWDDPLLLNNQLTDDERMVRDAAAAYCQDKLQPRILDAFRHERMDTSIFREMGELGLLGPTIPEQYGGPGLNYVAYGLNHGDFGDSERLWSVVGCIILLSILIHGVTATPLLRRLARRRSEVAD